MGYHVKRTGKDQYGDILRLCGDGFTVSREDAIRAIGRGQTYFVQQPGTRRAQIIVVTGRYLRTTPDSETANNLDNLPDC